MKLDEWQARERAAAEAEQTLRGNECRDCASYRRDHDHTGECWLRGVMVPGCKYFRARESIDD